MSRFNESFDYIRINLASPERIKGWASQNAGNSGEVVRAETLHYKTLQPEMGGLFCERIFGPTRNWECFCGKYKRVRQKIFVCERCGVEATDSRVRRHRMGYIELAYPVAHTWYVRGAPCYISLILGMKRRDLKETIYFSADPLALEWQPEVITAKVKGETSKKYYPTGAEMILSSLKKLNLKNTVLNFRANYSTASKSEKKTLIRRVRLVESFIATRSNPAWMILSIIPVLPPGLRPMVQLEGGRFATSDLNELYRRVINRNNRLKRLFSMYSPTIVIQNEKRMLQEAVDALIDNGRREKKAVDLNMRPLKSLSEILAGKQGRFRQNLLGKRVDYSGRSVIVVGPGLKLNQCGIPYDIACELFQPFIIQNLLKLGYASNMRIAKQLIQQTDPKIWDILKSVLNGFPIFLNRAPTLHRLGVQAFEPILVEGKAIKLHPLVCPAFNADFDGDQMAIHIPLSLEAQAESYLLMLGPNNFMSPATGEPILLPSQDMVLGSHYLTSPNSFYAKANHNYFANRDEVILSYECGQVQLHSSIWLRFSGIVETLNKRKLLRQVHFPDQTLIQIYTDLQVRRDVEGKILVQYLLTTPGRILFNQLIKRATH
jgi:DNA-directed RNA polymerase subunit beta'